MFCEKCGMQNDDINQFCYNCRSQLPNAQAYQNQGYTQPNPYANMQPAYPQPNPDEHVSVGTWIGIFFINLIPCVGSLIYFIMLFVWAFGGTPKKSLKTFAQAQLILFAIVLGLFIVLFAIFAALGSSLFDIFSSSYYNW